MNLRSSMDWGNTASQRAPSSSSKAIVRKSSAGCAQRARAARGTCISTAAFFRPSHRVDPKTPSSFTKGCSALIPREISSTSPPCSTRYSQLHRGAQSHGSKCPAARRKHPLLPPPPRGRGRAPQVARPCGPADQLHRPLLLADAAAPFQLPCELPHSGQHTHRARPSLGAGLGRPERNRSEEFHHRPPTLFSPRVDRGAVPPLSL